MVPLMERIAWQLAERVQMNINIKTIYSNTPQVVKKVTSEAKRCLETWKESYLEVRAKIEENERDARWEFDKIKKPVSHFFCIFPSSESFELLIN